MECIHTLCPKPSHFYRGRSRYISKRSCISSYTICNFDYLIANSVRIGETFYLKKVVFVYLSKTSIYNQTCDLL